MSLISVHLREAMEVHQSVAVEYLLDDAVVVHRVVRLLSYMCKRQAMGRREDKDKAN
jgi:hypothetical protein